MTALSSTRQPTSRTWEKVSEGRAVGVDCCDGRVSACGSACVKANMSWALRGCLPQLRQWQRRWVQRLFTKGTVMSLIFAMESGDGGFLFP